MEYNEKTGFEILDKYLKRNPRKFIHSIDVGNCAYIFASTLNKKHPALKIDANLARFLGYVHDIGQSITPEKHELKTIELLIKENIPLEIAFQSMHGQLLEQYPCSQYNYLYSSISYEGKILSVADMSIDANDGVISIEERAKRIKKQIENAPTISVKLKKKISNGMDLALPRFQKYRDELFTLMDIKLEELQKIFSQDYLKI